MSKFTRVPGYSLDLDSTTTAKGRMYHVGEDSYHSVTTVLGGTQTVEKTKKLEAWRTSLGRTKADQVTKAAAERGSAVHDLIEHYLNNEDLDQFEVDTKHKSMFNKVRPFLNRIDNIYCLEDVLFSDTLRIAGRVDCIAEYNGELSVIDFKTSINHKQSEDIEDYYLQVTAYALMMYEMYQVKIDKAVIIMATEKGLPMVFPIAINDYILKFVERVEQFHAKRKK